MNKEVGITKWIILCLLVCVISACASGDITGDFIEYNSLDDELGELMWERYQTAFTLKYPPDWEIKSYSEALVFLTSENLDAVRSNAIQDADGAFIDIMAGRNLSGELSETGVTIDALLAEMLAGAEIIAAPKATQINGHTAAQATFNDPNDPDSRIWIATLILEENAELVIYASSPTDRDLEFRPILEAIISSIKLQSAE